MNRHVITSLQNPRIKSALKLRSRRARKKQNRSIIDGHNEIARAFSASASLLEVFYCESLMSVAEFSLLKELEKAEVPAFSVTSHVFQKISYGNRCDGMVSTVETPTVGVHELRLGKLPLVIVMDRLQKPGNLGAVLRSADGAGADCVVVADGETDVYNPNTIRSSLGSVFTLPVCNASMTDTYSWLRQQNVRMLATRVEGTTCYTSVDFRQPVAIIFGNEADGLAGRWTQPDVDSVSIPMLGIADSLNVSAVAAVLLYEAIRQRAL